MTKVPEETAESTPPAPSRGRVRRRPRTGPEARERRRRLWTYGLLVFSGVLMVNALIGEKGYLATLRAAREYSELAQSTERLRAENRRLREQARRLQGDPQAIEEAARRDLGLIRPGETLVIIRDRTAAADSPRDR